MKTMRILIVFGLLGLVSIFGAGCNVFPKDETFASRALAFKAPATIVLTWNESSGNPQGYFVEQSTNGTDFYQIQNVSIPAITITDVPTGTYYFRIRSYNEAGNSDYSAIISATVN